MPQKNTARLVSLLCGTLLSTSALAQAPTGAGQTGHQHAAAQSADATRASAEWTQAPLLVSAARGPERGAATLAARHFSPPALHVHPSDTPDKPWSVELQSGRGEVRPLNPAEGGAHWISAEQSLTGSTLVASTVWFFASKGSSPERMLATPKNRLEIVPVPATNRYREGESWHFQLRFDGQPLAGAKLELETEQGSRQSLTADAQGMVRVTFPHDIDPARYPQAEEFSRVRSEFVLTVSKQVDEHTYVSAFNSAYMPDRMRERSLLWGAGFAALGMLLATPLLRRKEKRNA